jgi:hypothetical protein
MNTQALSEMLDKLTKRMVYAINQADTGLLHFTVGELEDLVHNMKLDLAEKVSRPEAGISEELIQQHLEFMGKSDE